MRLLSALLFLLAFTLLMAERRLRRWMGGEPKDNCATWAADNFDYDGGDGVMLHRTVSNSWLKFPHVVVVRGARHPEREHLTLIEYVPKVRDMDIVLPPITFDGEVRETRYARS